MLHEVMNTRWLEPDAVEKLPADMRGSYVLVVSLEKPRCIAAGRLAERVYPAGWYAYAGSALGGLKQRLGRYVRPERKRRWHIDYLLEYAEVTGVMIAVSRERQECRLAGILGERLETVRGFGSSDCLCSGHLFYHREERKIREAVASAFDYVEASARA